MHQRTQKTSVSEQDRQQNRRQAHGLYSCVHLDDQETGIDEVTHTPECPMDAKNVGQDFICFNFKDHPSAIGSTLDRKTARGFSCLLSVK